MSGSTRSTKTKYSRKRLKEKNQEAVSQVTKGFDYTKVKVKETYAYVAAFSAEVSLDGLEALIANENIAAVYEDKKNSPSIAQGLSLMKGSVGRKTFGGGGVSIAILDSGVDYNHPMLGGGGFPNSKVIGGTDTGEDDTDPMDTRGHGTAVASIAAGSIPINPVGDYIGGVAPDAKIYALKIAYSDAYAYDSDILEAIEWCISHQYDDPDNPIKVINISYGGGEYFGECDNADDVGQLYAQTIANAAQAGIAIFAAAGNAGYRNALESPACFSGIISVGEVYDADIGKSGPWDIASGECTDYFTSPDRVVCYSNSSANLDVLASGGEVATADILGVGGYNDSEDYYSEFGGTSAASPYAAGAAALVQSASYSYRSQFYSPSELKNILLSNGDLVLDSRNSIRTPRVNIHNSLRSFILAGDVNVDAMVDLKDSIIPLQILSDQPVSGKISTLGEYDQNGKLDFNDAFYAMHIDGEICSDFLTQFCTTREVCEEAARYWYDEECIPHPSRESESNDSLSDADRIVMDMPVVGRLSTTSDVDWYVVNLDGQSVVHFILTTTGYDAGYFISIYNSDGDELIRSNVAVATPEDEGRVLASLKAGTNYVRVSRWGAGNTDNVQYGLAIEPAVLPDLHLVETELNDQKETANTFDFGNTVIGQLRSISGLLQVTADQDWYVLETDKPDIVTVDFTNYDTTGLWFEYWYLSVYDEYDQVLSKIKVRRDDSFEVILPAAGKYYWKVETPEISISLCAQYYLTVAPREMNIDYQFETEPNNNRSVGNSIGIDESILGQLRYSPNDTDWYTLQIDEPQIVTIQLAPSSGSNFWRMKLYDIDDNMLGYADLGGAMESDTLYDVYFSLPGTYYLEVSKGDNTSSEPYILTMIPSDKQQGIDIYMESEPNYTLLTANELVFEQVVTGNLMHGGDRDNYRLEIVGEEFVMVRLDTSVPADGSTWAVSVRDENDVLISTSRISSGDTFEVEIPADGNYYFVVSGGSSIPYLLSVVPSDGQSLIDPEGEPNDDKASATPIVLNQLFTGHLMSEDDEDWYVVTTEQPEVVAFELTGEGWLDSIFISVYSSSDELLAAYELTNFSTSFVVALPEVGNHYLKVVRGSSGGDEQYCLTAIPFIGPDIPLFETEPNGTLLQADNIEIDQTISGQIMSEYDQDWYIVDVNQPQVVTIQFIPEATSFDCWVVSVRDPNGQLLAVSNVGDGDLFDVHLPSVGIYSIHVARDSDSYHWKGQYNLTIVSHESSSAPSVEIEPNNTRYESSPLELNVTISGQLMSSSDYDWYEFEIARAGVVELEVSPQENEYRAWRASVYNESGSLVGNFNLEISTTTLDVFLPTAGKYYVKVEDYDRYSNGQYYLKVKLYDEQSEPNIEREPNNEFSSSTPIELSNDISGQIVSDRDSDWYVLELEQPLDGIVKFTPKSGNAYWQMRIWNEDSTVLIYESRVGDKESYEVTFPSSGRYYLYVTDSYMLDTSSYSFQVVPVEQ
ncbi:S8 family peptidase [Desulfosediminicola flagellatus]|uniref:S8 family peptidase n=1 Tax=Desulfosediminicola flagellatus TaxID=2569541 RepID=UPI00142EE7D7|nr:S8 family serine peptidase [Desulfosediminicola flagellatus]